jgi:hypothetical protein
VSYPGERTRQFSLPPERVAEMRRLACQLSKAQGGARGDLRTQSRFVPSGTMSSRRAAGAGESAANNEAAAKAKGVKRVCIPNRSTKSPARKREQKKRWFRNGRKWRTGCEGRRVQAPTRP